eukprot:SAG11_NODE_4937_length_1717_cov_2.101978_2_plen_95_part_00
MLDDLAAEVDMVCCGTTGELCLQTEANTECPPAEDVCRDEGLVCDYIGPGEMECLESEFTTPRTCEVQALVCAYTTCSLLHSQTCAGSWTVLLL